MDRDSTVFRMLSIVLTGAGGGVLMAAILLFLLNQTGFSQSAVYRMLTSLTAAAFPAIFDAVGKRGIDPEPTEGILITVSLAVSLLYVHVSAAEPLTAGRMYAAVVLPHMAAYAVFLIRLLIARVSVGKESE